MRRDKVNVATQFSTPRLEFPEIAFETVREAPIPGASERPRVEGKFLWIASGDLSEVGVCGIEHVIHFVGNDDARCYQDGGARFSNPCITQLFGRGRRRFRFPITRQNRSRESLHKIRTRSAPEWLVALSRVGRRPSFPIRSRLGRRSGGTPSSRSPRCKRRSAPRTGVSTARIVAFP